MLQVIHMLRSKNTTPYGAAKGGKKGGFRPKPYPPKGKGKGKKSDQRIPKEIREAGGTATTPDGAPICFDFAFQTLQRIGCRGIPMQKRDITFAAYVMGRIQWPITRSIDSPASQRLGNANFPLVQLLCLTELMQISLTTISFCKLMHDMTIVVLISLNLISCMIMHM